MRPGARPAGTAAIVVDVLLLVVAGVYVAVKLETRAGASAGLTVLTTFYPVYEYARNVAGDRANVTLLVPMTVDVHAFEPTPNSVASVATANVLIYNGAGLEPWIGNIVNASGNAHLLEVDTSAGIQFIPVPPKWQSE